MRSTESEYRHRITDPSFTASLAAKIPDCLHEMISETMRASKSKRNILISSNSLANRFILLTWGIRPSQKRKFKTLFVTVRRRTRSYFHFLLKRGRYDLRSGVETHPFGVYKFDEIRGNLILGFVTMPGESDWQLPV